MIDNLVTLIRAIQRQGLGLWLNSFSVNTWERIEFVRTRNRLKIFETTVTQNLLFEITKLSEAIRLPIKMYESVSERTNGNDLEILLQTKKGYILFPCQAKIIYPHDRYQQLAHVVGGREQINLLIEYAKDKGGIPMYLFYSYCSNQKWHKEVQNLIPFDIRYYGCSLVNAETIKSKFCEPDKANNEYIKWQIPTFRDIHPQLAEPLFVLGDSENRFLSVGELIKKVAKTDANGNERVYSEEEIREDPAWRELVPSAQIGRTNEERENRNRFVQGDEEGFNPKFRFVFTTEFKTRISFVY